MNFSFRRGQPMTRWYAAWALFAACALLRVGLVDRQGLWSDEFFSLAMATGHSLEHPAGRADPALGDFVEAPDSVPPSAYSCYLRHDQPPAGATRVLRAVLLSDTSPPLYYLLLNGWTRVCGTSDAALRLFSVAWALACFPILWSLARFLGGRVAAAPTCLLFTVSPVCLYYSTEGRPYTLLWFWTVCTMWLTLRLWRVGFRPGRFLLWVSVGAAGWLTHYFFVFVWLPAAIWLLLYPGRLPRKYFGLGVALIGVLILPWYIHLPESLANWRVTMDWLRIRPGGYEPLKAFLYLPGRFLSIRGTWGGSEWADRVNLASFVILGAAAWWTLSWSLFTVRRQLLWLWLAGSCLGPVVFDLLCGTYVVAVPRYALAGMPAAFLLAGLGLGRLRRPLPVGLTGLIVLACLTSVQQMYVNESRHYEPYRQIGHLLGQQATAGDLVIIHSIPSGVAGIARYLERSGCAEGVWLASWVGQLEQRRVPDDLRTLAARSRRIIVVKIHDVGEPAPEEAWLRQNARLSTEEALELATILCFRPGDGDQFFP
jgi:hypothetical protein